MLEAGSWAKTKSKHQQEKKDEQTDNHSIINTQ